MTANPNSKLYKYDKVHTYLGDVRYAARQFHIPVALLMALIDQESGWNPTIGSPKGAYGLTQLMPHTADALGVGIDEKTPAAPSYKNSPALNIAGGAKYLSEQYATFKSWPLALAAYNAGPGRVIEAHGQIPNIPETQNYVKSILVLQTKYEGY